MRSVRLNLSASSDIYLATEVLISPWVKERELRRFDDQVTSGLEDGWLRVEEPSATDVRHLVDAVSNVFDLDQGEAETLIIASHQEGLPTTVLIDEGEAFVFVEKVLLGRGSTRNWRLVCLGDLLHDLELSGIIDSTDETMQRLLDGDFYRWAPAVRSHYERRCAQRGVKPLPRTRSRSG